MGSDDTPEHAASQPTVIVSPRATRNIERIEAYLREEASVEAAMRQLERIEARLDGLRTFPSREQTVEYEGRQYHRIVERPYVVYYTMRGGAVFVARVLHGARDRGYSR